MRDFHNEQKAIFCYHGNILIIYFKTKSYTYLIEKHKVTFLYMSHQYNYTLEGIGSMYGILVNFDDPVLSTGSGIIKHRTFQYKLC